MSNIPENTSIRFRFVFQTDGSIQFDGIAIDNFIVTELSTSDLSVNRIIQPSNNSICGGLSSYYISIELQNKGSDTISNINLYYQINNGNIVADTLLNPIAPGKTVNFAFQPVPNRQVFINSTIKTWADSPNDSLQLNDTAKVTISTIHISNVNSLVLLQDFDNWQAGASTAPYGWSRTPITGPGWYSSNGGSPSPGTGPNDDATGGNFWYLESSTTYFQDPTLNSPCIDLINTTSPMLFFLYHKYGATMGNLYVDVYDGLDWVNIDIIRGQTQLSGSDPWKLRAIDLSDFKNQVIQIRFRGRETPTDGFQSDMAIDDVRIIDASSNIFIINDLQLDNIHCNSGVSPGITIKYNHFSNQSLDKDSILFSIYQNGVLLGTHRPSTNIDSIAIDSTLVFNISSMVNQLGDQSIKVVSTLIRDQVPIRDSISISFVNKIHQLPYQQSFDSIGVCHAIGNSNSIIFEERIKYEGWYQDFDTSLNYLPNSKWYLLNQNNCNSSNFTINPYDGSGFLIASYPPYESGYYLYSPCFDLSSYSSATLEYRFQHVRLRLLPTNFIGDFTLEVDSMGVWVEIQRHTSTPFISSTWFHTLIDISNYLSSKVQFRFQVDSSNSTNFVSETTIDAFKIYDPLATELEETPTNTQSLSIYPNPNNGEFRMDVPKELIGEEYVIFDLSGKIIQRSIFQQTTEEVQVKAQKGIYFIRIPNLGVSEKIILY